jgi:sensor histidine kinase regulating citrate/malate metabolism
MATIILDKVQKSPQHNHLWWRISIILILVISFVLSLISFLNYSNYRKNFLELHLTRYQIMGKDLRQTIESGLNIGIFPFENTNLLPTIKALATRQSGTRYVAILEESGVILQEGKVPANSTSQWKERLNRNTTDNYWQSSNPQTLEIGIPFSNNFGQKIGAVVIGYDRSEIEHSTSEMLRKIILNCIETILLCAAVIFGFTYFLTKKLLKDLHTASKALYSGLQENEPINLQDDVLGNEISQEINAFTAIVHKASHELHQIEVLASATPLNTPSEMTK